MLVIGSPTLPTLRVRLRAVIDDIVEKLPNNVLDYAGYRFSRLHYKK